MGKKIEVTPGFCAMILLMGWLNGSVCLCFLLAAVIHECAHLLMAIACNIPIESISFRPCGAVIWTGPACYIQELLVTVAGPAVNLVTALITKQRFGEFAAIGFILAAVNLLPIYPMDGGRMLRCILMLFCAPAAAQRFLRATAFAVCGILMLFACWYTVKCQAGVWPIFAALAILWRAGDAATEEWT